jgi:hypothetical protein
MKIAKAIFWVTPTPGKNKGTGYVFGPCSSSPLPAHALIIATSNVVLQEKHSAALLQEEVLNGSPLSIVISFCENRKKVPFVALPCQKL